VPAPRCRGPGYARWRGWAQRTGDFLARHRRDVLALLALPLPSRRSQRHRDALVACEGLNSSFVQVAYPWLRPVNPPRCAEGLVAPDGALAGLVAATALTRGAFRTAAGRAPVDVFAVEPLPPVAERVTPAAGGEAPRWTNRLSLFAPRLHRIELLSDRTTSDRSGWHNASTARLMGQLLREARLIGEAFAFESNGPALWRAVARNFESLLTAWWQQGALRGETPQQAFDVRCGPAVMNQSDLDNGRLICRVAFWPALSIERLHVDLLLREAAGVGWRDVASLAEVNA
jgi:phage tail sheath protein FI